MSSSLFRRLALVVFTLFLAGYSAAETMVEYSAESRFQLDVLVPDAALKTFLPEGFTMNVATQGPAKDCNLRVLFTDRITVNGPDGKPMGKGSNRIVYLAVPVKDRDGKPAQLVIGGLSEDPADAPGPFGNYLRATTHKMLRTSSSYADGSVIEVEDWRFSAPSGEHVEMRIEYERGGADIRKMADVLFYSAKNPSFYQVSRQEQVLDIMRNTTTNPPDHVKKFSFKAGGGSYAKLFDGTEKFLSWDKILWINRTVLVP